MAIFVLYCRLFTLYLCYDGGYTTTFSAIIYPAAMVAIQAMEAISSVIPVCLIRVWASDDPLAAIIYCHNS